jgi:hypothetical protein
MQHIQGGVRMTLTPTPRLESIEPLRGEWKLEAWKVHKGDGMIEGHKVELGRIVISETEAPNILANMA